MQTKNRWVIILIATLLLTIVAFYALTYTAQMFGAIVSDDDYLHWSIKVGISALLFTGSQVLFVLPLIRPPRASSKGTSLKWSICIAGFVAAILTVALGMLVASVVTTMIIQSPDTDRWAILPAVMSNWGGRIFLDKHLWEVNIFTIELVVLLVSWIIWSTLLLAFVRRRHRDPGALVRITGWLFAGSLVEVLLSIPLYIMVQRRTDCYCATGAFGALVMSIMACLWLFGPGIVIVIFWRKRPWAKDHCSKCGCPKKVASATICSECGTKIN